MSQNSDKKRYSNHWEELVNTLEEPILIINTSGKILYSNSSACKLFGQDKDKLIDQYFPYHIDSNSPKEINITQPDQTSILAEMHARLGNWSNNKAWIITLHDVTQHKKIENDLKISANVFKFAREGIIITDKKGAIIDVNDEFTRITGYPKEEIIGQNPKILQSKKHDSQFYHHMWNIIQSKGYWRGEIWNRKKNKEIYPEMLSISAVKSSTNDIINYVGIFSDRSEQVHQQEKLEEIAHYDILTGLPNRLLFTDRLEVAMAQAKRSKHKLAVAFLDLDNFKEVNDNYGHEVGDQLLSRLAKIYQKTLRGSDTLSRFGGDEFVLLMPDLHTLRNFSAFLDRLLDIINQPQHINNLDLKVSASLGITFYPQEETITPDELIRQSDQAMYQAKITGKNKYVLFDKKMDKKLKAQNKYHNEIKQALNRQDFTLYYQPKVNMLTGKILGVEALIRWRRPNSELLFPKDFLPFIEADPFSIKLGEWVINAALSQIQTWSLFNKNFTISVNISALQLEQDDFVNHLNNLLSVYPENHGKRLEFEISEPSMLINIDKTSALIKQCNELGIEFSLDDFGIGYSSLTYLKQLPVKYLKIDQGFISDIINNQSDVDILKAIITIANTMNIQIIAEGVETQEHVKLLLQLGCELGQGFAIAKPMPAEQFEQWYQSWKPDPNWR